MAGDSSVKSFKDIRRAAAGERKGTQLVIVSAQLLAAVIPVLQENPAQVCLVASEKASEDGSVARLEGLLKRWGFEVGVARGCPDNDMEAIRGFATRVISKLTGFPGCGELVFNLTGGNKLMSFGFMAALENALGKDGCRVIYTDTANARIEQIAPVFASQPMRDLLGVEEYLRVQGFDVSSSSSDEASWREKVTNREQLTADLARCVADRSSRADLPQLNRAGSDALDRRNNLAAPRQSLAEALQDSTVEVLNRMAQFSLLKWVPGKLQIEFLTADAARFLSGGWLEEYAWNVFNRCELFDVGCSVEGVWAAKGGQLPSNEFDAVAVHANRMLLVECKTARMIGEHIEQKGQDVFTKLDSLGHRAGGAMVGLVLLSANPLRSADQRRYENAGISILTGPDIMKFEDVVRGWKQD